MPGPLLDYYDPEVPGGVFHLQRYPATRCVPPLRDALNYDHMYNRENRNSLEAYVQEEDLETILKSINIT